MDDHPFIHCDICDMHEKRGGNAIEEGVCERCAFDDGFEPCTECNRTICFKCVTKECNAEIVHKCLSCTKKAHITLIDRLHKIEADSNGARDRGWSFDAAHEIQQLIGRDK